MASRRLIHSAAGRLRGSSGVRGRGFKPGQKSGQSVVRKAEADLLASKPAFDDHEIRAQGLREFAGLTRDDQRLDPFELAKYAKLLVITFDQIVGLSEESIRHLLGEGKDMWSGGAASHKLPDGRKLEVPVPGINTFKRSPERE